MSEMVIIPAITIEPWHWKAWSMCSVCMMTAWSSCFPPEQHQPGLVSMKVHFFKVLLPGKRMIGFEFCTCTISLTAQHWPPVSSDLQPLLLWHGKCVFLPHSSIHVKLKNGELRVLVSNQSLPMPIHPPTHTCTHTHACTHTHTHTHAQW